MSRATIADLAFAVDWLEAYDASHEDDTNGGPRDRVVEWIKAEIERRETEALLRAAAKKHGVSVATVKKALAKKRST